ncbi:minor tail protein [Mycobacterium phage Saguaro]|uniref:Minor tail protein n=1 Tax=Mycobacterium phage Saguaro TaxID=2315616 RepID=A0A386KCK0_9CAUD|nr:minor tail protein [Mycobacterium phage Saguaro]AYD82024.1 minor tail protein [Mycobacterium phage Saguaro]
MAFRGYFALNGVEIANSSRVVSHIGADIPTRDIGLLTPEADCSLTPVAPGRLLATTPPSSAPIAPGRLLGTPPDGSRLYGPGLAVVGDCWTPEQLCYDCRERIGYDDSWPGLAAQLGDTIYRPELAPWYSVRVPESAEFSGVWVMDVKGLDTTPTQREVTEMAGDGGAAGPSRSPARKLTFDAVLLACSNAGLAYGLQWLSCQLRDTINRTDSVLRYFAAHPEHSAADPATLVREVHGVVLTQEPQVTDAQNASRKPHSQATMYRVTWELTVTRPHAYSPPMTVPVDWDTTTVEPIRWVHAADCKTPESCEDMPVLYAASCAPERIEAVTSPPPSCGGCLPVCAVVTHVFEVPTFDYPLRCHETVASLVVRNTGERDLTLQGSWRLCAALEGCDTDQFPFQVNELPPTAELHLDGISGRYWVYHQGRKRRPVGIVGTPTGAPWRPAIIDRSRCWELVAVSDGDSQFEMSLSLADREA